MENAYSLKRATLENHCLYLARIFHELPAATTDMSVLHGVLGCFFDTLPLRRTLRFWISDFGSRIFEYN